MFYDKRVFDAAAQSGGDFGDLPEWDLSDLYSSETAPELTRDLEWLNSACVDFANDFEYFASHSKPGQHGLGTENAFFRKLDMYF